jgi:putative phage-type endonuclease
MDQRSTEWFAARAGKVTASCISKVMARTKTGYGADRGNYLAQLVVERLTGTAEPGFTNAAMQWGTDKEPDARACYEFECGVTVVEVGFAEHPTIAMAGASPDGLVGNDGLVEIKCPNTATHIATLTGAPIDDKYVRQMQFQMACTGRQWCDFVSYDPRMPVEMQLHVRRVERDDELVAKIEEEVTNFLAEVEATVTDLNTRYRKAA